MTKSRDHLLKFLENQHETDRLSPQSRLILYKLRRQRRLAEQIVAGPEKASDTQS